MKGQHSEWEKVNANEAIDKGLISKMYSSCNSISKKQANQKMSRRPKETFLQSRQTDGQESHEKTLNITNYLRNANQNYGEV